MAGKGGREAIAELPCWRGAWQAEPLTGGLSNEIWKVTDAAGAHVVRFGADYPWHHVDREREAMAARAAHAAGFAPAVEHTGPGVMVTAFVEARTWGPEDVAADPARVGRLLARFHREMPAHVSGPGYIFWVFHVVRDYARTLAEAHSPHARDLPRYLALNAALEDRQVPLPIVFGHHDLLPANFLDDGERLWLIDYEYAGFSTPLFDLAGAVANAGMPPEAARELIGAYLDRTPPPELLRAFDAMQCAALLREAMWAMVSALFMSAPGVDYDDYARQNLAALDEAVQGYSAAHRETLP
jgi:thiamine kinase-like enzyme